MFMEPGLTKNTLQLLKVRLQSSMKTNIEFLIVIIFSYLLNLGVNLTSAFRYADGVRTYSLGDYSIFFIAITIIRIIYLSIKYKHDNEKLYVYPATNISRFLSSQFVYYIYLFVTAFFCMVLYFIQYGVIRLVISNNPNIKLAYRFNLKFILSGFLVLIIYSFLITGTICVITALIRKFKIYACILLIAAAGLLISNLSKSIAVLKRITEFLVQEHNVIPFLLKGLLLWLVLFIIAFMINKYTIYYQSYKKISWYLSAAISIFSIVLVILLASDGYSTTSSSTSSAVIDDFTKTLQPEIVLDASSITPGSKITIDSGDAIVNTLDNSDYEHVSGEMKLYLDYDPNDFKAFHGSKIKIYYKKSDYLVNDIPILDYINLKISAALNGNTLNLNCTYDKNTKIIFLSPWSFMKQFDVFTNKRIFKESIGETERSGSSSLYIEAE